MEKEYSLKLIIHIILNILNKIAVYDIINKKRFRRFYGKYIG